MRVFVTGGSGFIGRHLLPLLHEHEVLCIGRRADAMDASLGVRAIRGDLSVLDSYAEALARFKPECCIHLAWQGLPDYSFSNCRANVDASLDLFELLGGMGCRTIFAAGTCWEYAGLSAAVSEHQQGWNTNMFAAFKSGLQTMGQSLFRRHGSRFIWGRLFFVYGPGQRMSSLIPSCYRSFAIEGASPNIANPLALNDFIHVADVGAAIRALIEGDGDGGIYNIGTGEPVAVWQVVNMVAEMMGASRAYRDLSPPSDGFWADIAKMRALGWQPELSIRDGIARTLESMAKVRK